MTPIPGCQLTADEKRITEELKAEEERFFETLETGMQILVQNLLDLRAFARTRSG